MAEVASNGPVPAPNDEQVPLDTIPVSPNGAMTDVTNGSTANGKTDGDHVVTVFDDPANFNVKHALQNAWTLWFTKPPSGKQDWNELLKEVISFDSVEEFWGIYVRACAFPSTTCSRAPANFASSIEQHHTRFRTSAEVRLPPLQARRAPRMGGPAEQVRRPLVLHLQEQQGQRWYVAECHAVRHR